MKKFKFINFNQKKKTHEIIYLFDERITGTIGRTFVSCIMIMIFFYSAPIFVNFIQEDVLMNEYRNNSRTLMVYKLNGKNKLEENTKRGDEEIFNEKDLLSDIISLNELENDSVRLSASTILQLFNDTN